MPWGAPSGGAAGPAESLRGREDAPLLSRGLDITPLVSEKGRGQMGKGERGRGGWGGGECSILSHDMHPM